MSGKRGRKSITLSRNLKKRILELYRAGVSKAAIGRAVGTTVYQINKVIKEDKERKTIIKSLKIREPTKLKSAIKFTDLVKPSDDSNKLERKVSNQIVKLLSNLESKDIDANRENIRDNLEDLLNIIEDKKFVLIIQSKEGKEYTFTLSESSTDDMKNFLDELNSGFLVEKVVSDNSGAQIYRELVKPGIKSILVKQFHKSKGNSGKFFKYFVNKNYDLTPLQIYKNLEELRKNYKDHCLINSLKYYDIPDEKLNEIKKKIRNNYVRKRDFTSIAELIGKTIYLKTLNDDATLKSTYYYNKKSKGKISKEDKVNLILFREHYMPNINLPISTFSIKNYDELKDNRNFEIIDRYVYRKGKQYVNRNKKVSVRAEKILRALTETDSFTVSGDMAKVINKNKIEETILTNIDEDQRKVEYNERDGVDEKLVFFADFEAITQGVDYHKPFLLGVINYDESYLKFFRAFSDTDVNNNTMFSKMLKNIINKHNLSSKQKPTPKPIIYFHNLKYDFSLIKANTDITLVSECSKDGILYSVVIRYLGINFYLKDTYKYVSTPLSKFADMFGTAKKIDFDLYDYFTMENYNKPKAPLEDLEDFFTKRDMDFEKFKQENLKYIREDSVNIRSLYIEYLKFDCVSLCQGIKKFRQYIRDITELDLFSYLTISSLGHDYVTSLGVYDGCYEVKGNLRDYIMQAFVGGRVCSKDNEKWVIEEELEDFDAVSLYPSAMTRCEYPKGKAKIFKTAEIENAQIYDLRNYDDYIIDCSFTLVGYQQIPMNSRLFIEPKTQAKKRIWDNLGAPEGTTICKEALEDLTRHYVVKDFKATKGVYWNSGRNKKIQKVIRELFERRLQAKREKNEGLQQTLKLLMNKIYGKTAIKPSREKISYVENKEEKINKFIQNNYQQIKIGEKINSKYKRFKLTKNMYDDFNLSHIGCQIVAKSKTIMNEVLGVANDCEIPVYYTDTDSMHITKSRIDDLSTAFQNKYNRELIGKDMGQFHVDFTDYKDEEGNYHKQWSKYCIILGKKSYLDILTNDLGVEGYHVRFKGAHEENLKHYCKDNDISLIDLYKSFAEGEEHKIDLCKGKVRFEVKENYVRTRTTFERAYKF